MTAKGKVTCSYCSMVMDGRSLRPHLREHMEEHAAKSANGNQTPKIKGKDDNPSPLVQVRQSIDVLIQRGPEFLDELRQQKQRLMDAVAEIDKQISMLSAVHALVNGGSLVIEDVAGVPADISMMEDPKS